MDATYVQVGMNFYLTCELFKNTYLLFTTLFMDYLIFGSLVECSQVLYSSTFPKGNPEVTNQIRLIPNPFRFSYSVQDQLFHY